MDYGNINWILAIVCLLAGMGIGAMGLRVIGSNATRLQQHRRKLAERERELTQLKEQLTEHFAEAGTLVNNIRREARALEHRLSEDAGKLGQAVPTVRPSLDVVPPDHADPEQADTEQAGIPVPRDYADGRGGTLSEDFGLKSDDDTAKARQPPRY